MTRNGAIAEAAGRLQAGLCGGECPSDGTGKGWCDGRGGAVFIVGRKERTKRTVLPHPLPSAG
jgi:hypothetical protein